MHNLKKYFSFLLTAILFSAAFSGCKTEQPTVQPEKPAATAQTPLQSEPNTFGNTVKIKYEDGKTADIFFDAGGTEISVAGKNLSGESKASGKRKYFAGGTQICEVKSDDSGSFKIRTADGKLLWKVKFSPDKIKISDNEENLNAFEIKKNDDGAKIERGAQKLGEVKFYADRKEIKVKDGSENKLFDANAEKFSAVYGVLALTQIPEDLRFVIAAELLSRNL